LYQVLRSSCLKLLTSKFSLVSQNKANNKLGLNLKSQSVSINKNTTLYGLVIKRFNSNLSHLNINKDFNILAYITGIIDAEGSFFIKVVKNSAYATNYSIQLTFGIILHEKDVALLKIIKTNLKGIGHI